MCMRVDGQAFVRACVCACSVPVHEHFVYSNCNESENLPCKLRNIKLVTEKVKLGCLSSLSPLQIQGVFVFFSRVLCLTT